MVLNTPRNGVSGFIPKNVWFLETIHEGSGEIIYLKGNVSLREIFRRSRLCEKFPQIFGVGIVGAFLSAGGLQNVST